MSKKDLFFFPLTVYEVFRLFFILIFQVHNGVQQLPLSWYMALPLFILPFFLLPYIKQNTANGPFALFLYTVLKSASLAGYIAFGIKTFSGAAVKVALLKTYSVKQLGLLVIFFIIDVILCAVMAVCLSCRKNDKTEGELCK